MSTSNTAQSIKFKLAEQLEETQASDLDSVVFFCCSDDTVESGLYSYKGYRRVRTANEKWSDSILNKLKIMFSDYGVNKIFVANVKAGTLAEAAEDKYVEAELKWFNRVDENAWLYVDNANTDESKLAVKTWITTQRNELDYQVKSVLYCYKADEKSIFNFTDSVNGKDYVFRVVADAATLTAQESMTNKTAKGTDNCEIKEDDDECISNGELILMNNGTEIVYGTGVNSLQTLQEGETETLTKMRHVACIDLVKYNLRKFLKKSILGKQGNSFTNRNTLRNRINTILKGYAQLGYLSNDEESTCQLSVEQTKDYLDSVGRSKEYEDLKDDAILKLRIGDNVFFDLDLVLMDTMEHITIRLFYKV